MSFSLRMALREFRRGSKRFIFFLLCIAAGVAGLVGIKGFNANLQSALLREARSLMAADMTVSVSKSAGADQLQLFDELRAQGIQVVHNTETASMAVNPTTKDTVLVEIKATEPGYPFYGTLELNPSGELTDQTAYVGQDLLDRLALQPGDAIKVGNASFLISGVITKEPDRVTAGFSAGPRVMLSQGGLARANLIQFGSRARHVYLLKLSSDQQVSSVRSQLADAFAKEKPRIADFREAQPQVKTFLDRMTSFLALVSMVALLVGGLGVANATRVFLQQKLDSIAILKCVGATNRKVTGIYLTQMLLLSLAGSLLGILFGYAIQLLLPRVVGNVLGLTLTIQLSPLVALQGITVGLLTSILFTLLPLTAIADVKPALVFRRDMAEQRPGSTWRARIREGILLVAIGAGLGLIAAWISGSLKWGFYFVGGLAAAVLILGGASAGAVWLVRRIHLPRTWVTARQGLSNLYRPGSQASAIVLALGIGVTMVLAVYLLQRGLMQEVRLTTPAGTPNMFFMGLQSSDAGSFRSFLEAQPGVQSAPEPTPVVRGKLLRVNGKTKDELSLTQEEERWFNFQFSLTYSATLPAGNQVVEGDWWTEGTPAEPLVSVESEAARRLNLTVGSTVEMDLEGGHPVTATVANIRKATDVRAGNAFNFVFAPGALEGVPVNYLAQARVEPSAAGAVTRAVVAQYPTLTVINLNEVLETVGAVLDRIGLVIRFVAGFSVVAGLIILASSIAATKYRRTRDAVLYKTLGATRRKVWRIFAMEYSALGLVAGLVGAGLAAAAAWVVFTYVLDMTYRLEILPLLGGVAATWLLTVAIGLLSTLDVLATKPLQVLREE